MSDPTKGREPAPALHTIEMQAATATWRAITAERAAPAGSEADPDLGFGRVVAEASRQRFLNRDGSFNVEREGLGLRESLSPYHTAMALRWGPFLLAVAGAYLACNLVFALFYLLCGPGALRGSDPSIPDGSYLQAFLFSVQTLATIGYGAIVPIGRAANLVVTIEAYTGILLTAIATGLTISRFTRPTARLRFSAQALIAPYGDGWALMFRMANARRSQLIELRAQVLFASFQRQEGRQLRRFVPLALEREQVLFFPLAWTVVHPITPESPLWGLTAADLHERDAELLVLVSGFDEAHAQVVHARSSYKPSEIVWNARFRNMFAKGSDQMAIDMRLLDVFDRLG